VIGTVEGDVHDIGKNIVKMMFDVAGFTVYDWAATFRSTSSWPNSSGPIPTSSAFPP